MPAPANVPITWLCRPGTAHDPCRSNLAATVVPAPGAASVSRAEPASKPDIDCFYVYPTVSTQPTVNADLTVDPQETAVAVDQASRFSQVCDVHAPMYRQLTLASIGGKAAANEADRDIA
jgi:hypothetical protein